VFEKVNTGGKPLDAFELVTAMYAADGHELRKDWYGDDDAQGATSALGGYVAPGRFRGGHHRQREQYRFSAGDLTVLSRGSAAAKRNVPVNGQGAASRDRAIARPC
jgi:hypothetical protein